MTRLPRRLAPLLALALCACAPPLWADPGERGRALYDAGRYAEAEPYLRRALAEAERRSAGPPGEEAPVADASGALADLLFAQGRQREAEPLLERAIAIRERASGPDDPRLAPLLNRWATLHLDRDAPAPAAHLLERARAILERAGGPEGRDLAAVLNNLGLAREGQKRFAEAEALYLDAIRIRESLPPGPDRAEVAAGLTNLGTLYAEEGRYGEAEPLLERSLAIRERALGPAHPRLAASVAHLGVLRADQGRAAEAEALLRRALAIAERAFGPDGPRTAPYLALLANLQAGQDGRAAEALASARRADTAAQGGAGPHHAHDGDAAAAAESDARAARSLVRAGWALAEAEPGLAPALADETFRAGQRAHATDAAASVARVAARFAARDDALARLIRQQQDSAARWRRLDAALVEAASMETAGPGRAGAEALGREVAQAGARLATLDRELTRRFPGYGDLVNPEAAGVAEVQRLLGPDEALLAYLVVPPDREWLEEGAVFRWLVRPGRAELRRLDLAPAGLERAVRHLRTQLDPDRWSGPGSLWPPFDAAAARALHAHLLPPEPAALAGVRHLLVVPDGPLESLPFSVLVRAPPPPGRPAYRDVDWLARTIATTTLPSVTSLRALRRLAGTSRAPEPFRGVGDPALGGPSPAGPAAPGANPDLRALRALPPLPETAEELRLLAARLGAGDASLLLRETATETAVKAGALARARVVAFATHAGVAGQLPGLAEPALVLTPPAVASAEDDGLLTMSEAAHLDLDADLVLLSACNTAAPGGAPGAPGLSGLAQAFIYAGSRSLLVSHWSVVSEAAERLTTGMLTELARDPELGRAEALRRAMTALIADEERRPDLAHPAAWAPFVVVGQGGAPARFR